MVGGAWAVESFDGLLLVSACPSRHWCRIVPSGLVYGRKPRFAWLAALLVMRRAFPPNQSGRHAPVHRRLGHAVSTLDSAATCKGVPLPHRLPRNPCSARSQCHGLQAAVDVHWRPPLNLFVCAVSASISRCVLQDPTKTAGTPLREQHASSLKQTRTQTRTQQQGKRRSDVKEARPPCVREAVNERHSPSAANFRADRNATQRNETKRNDSKRSERSERSQVK